MQASKETPGCCTCAAVSPIEKLRDTLLRVAVSVTEVLEVTAVGALAVKAALEFPVAIETELGTVTDPLLLESPTLTFDVAAPLRLTVHVDVPGGVNPAGEQLRFESAGPTGWLMVTVAPVPVSASAVPPELVADRPSKVI